METSAYSRIVMLGPAPDVHDGTASVIEACRAGGLFGRWPIEYLATRWSPGFVENSKKALRAARDLAMLLARHRGAVVHVHASADGAFWRDCAFMALAAAGRCPLVLQLHGGGFESLYDRGGSAARVVMVKALEAAAVVVVPSEALRHWVASVTGTARVRLVPSPVRASPAKSPRAKENIVLFLGALNESKGVFDLLEAIGVLRRAVPDARLVCAGEGDRAAVARYAERLGIRDAVELTGWLGPSGKRALFETACALALPAYSAGLPMSVLEAMAAGLPVVATSTGAIPEAIVDGASGFLVAPGDTATLARTLQKVLVDRELAARIGGAARESVRLRHAPERALARLEDVYASLGVARLDAEPRSARRGALREAA